MDIKSRIMDIIMNIEDLMISIRIMIFFRKTKIKCLQVLRKIWVIIPDPLFSLCKTFELTVPNDYNHSTRLTDFINAGHKKLKYNKAITDTNFSCATNRLIPGKKYLVKIFKITWGTTSENCLDFLRGQKAILVGAQGLSLVWEMAKEKFPIDKLIVSFDEREALYECADGRCIPGFNCSSEGAWNFRLGNFEYRWIDEECFICICDLPTGRQA